MQGERNSKEWRSVQWEEEDNCWRTVGYKYPQIQNSNDYIPEFWNLREKSRNFRLLKTLPTVARTVGTSEKNFGTSEQQTAGAKQLQVTSLGVRIKV
jgi:hypothetical protein